MASYDSGMLSAGGVADQQQGWLQSLHPCARLLLGCGAVCSSGDVIAGAEGEDCGPEWGLLARFKRSWIPELINTALILYSWRVGLSLKTVSTISNNLSASIQNLNEVERQMSRVQQQQRVHEQQQHWEREQQQQAAAAAGEEEDWAPDIERREGGLGTEAGRRRGRQTPGQQLQETLNYLQEARNVLREDVSSNVRYMRMLKAVFFSGWKREALLALSGWLSRGLLASSDKGALLGYMPSVYMEVVMDVMNTLCKSEDEDLSQLLLRSSAQQPTRTITQPITEPQGGPEPMDTGPDGEEDGGQQGYTPALLDSVHMLVGVLADPRVAHPDAKEQIMATLTTMLGHRIILGAVEEVELHPRAGKGPRFVSMVVTAFDSQDWHPITNLLKRITVGHGFGHQGLHAGKLVAEKKAGAIRPGSRQGSGPYPSPVLQGMMAEVLSSGSEASKRFLNRLFSTLGWALTEFSVTGVLGIDNPKL
ncbi:hypothetical protein DUNSADRAFT_16115 [Dunaliella salina]|uniref:Uncharacterized protein n=1 Tax=Dunaliella salina TaxID=3046 RepID=A0ABQ7H197_DUNSA|nr:hypothetical protein DUNSADRAFT_16115 [Dunaliella salina]|eukprot:KAF5840600.1 hypothetical protein DUNSADRAFT_16115 [Dunaliella salina]